jgi:hypothetical protein
MDMADIILVCGLLFTVGIFGMFTVETIYTDPITIVVGDYQIRSLHDGAQISGSFSLGSGYIRQEPQFVFYQTVEKGYQLKTCPAAYTTVIEDENATPYLRITDYAQKGKIFNTISQRSRVYELHVPSGTIIQEWKLDGTL